MNFTRAVVNIFGALALLYGVYAAYMAQITPDSYSLYRASATQATQVYSEGIYWASMACAAFLFALCCVVSSSQWNRIAQPALQADVRADPVE